MECPSCDKGCLVPAEDVLAGLDRLYMACPKCAAERYLDKRMPFSALKRDSHATGLCRCKSCGRAPLDLVMLEIMQILVGSGLREDEDPLRSAGSPIPVIGYPLAYPPRLGYGDLIFASENLNRHAARSIMGLVPEVKGVIQTGGVPGVSDDKKRPHKWKLLDGCDLRCDVVHSIFGDVVVYKSQSKIHLEISRPGRSKIRILEELFSNGLLTDVVDGLCGPGTLGLTCILAGARRVVFNDIWSFAVENVIMNLEANKNILGLIDVELISRPTREVSKRPVLVGRAGGSCEVEVYQGDLRCLFDVVRPAGVCLIDHFPGAPVLELEKAGRACREVVLI